MRYVLAIVALAISGVLLLLGIGQRTFLAGPSEIVYPIAAESDAPYAVLDVSELTKVDGQANVVMRGSSAFSALATTRDAQAWLEPFDHVELTVDPSTKAVVTDKVAGKAPTTDVLALDDEGIAVPIDPRGSDLWLSERSGDEGVSRMAIEPAADQSILIAGNGTDPIPKGTALVWVQDRATPWAGPLLAAGGLFAVLGAVLYLIAFDRDKRALGPRRGRSGPLLGVRNVFTPSGKRSNGNELDSAPRRGSNDNTPSVEAGAAAGAATDELTTGATDSNGESVTEPETSGEEIVTAEVIEEDQDASDVAGAESDPGQESSDYADAEIVVEDVDTEQDPVADGDGDADADADVDTNSDAGEQGERTGETGKNDAK